ncbi:archaea-specific SMC-related protein [Natronosalvus vescus]|uniref:archaea-specific SMC-related protein n=1 Tax=Natronosalvus vescus TaxID=2953881 RepID=UPI0020916BCA|nr:archaea-specific SMC-related protein [Natronosalvus vescus]
MSSGETTTRPRLAVENIGGIDSTTVELSPGVNILTGRNATNRTSFLQSIMGALGSDQVSLKADAESGSVRLEIGGETYERHFERRSGQVVSSGNPYLDDPTLANLFAFLLESNTARRAVSQKEDLREVIMRPVDVDEITAQIDQAETEKRQLDEEIDRVTSMKSTLPSLEERRQSLREQVEETEAELEESRADLEAKKAEADDEDDDELDAKLDELQSARGDLEETEFQLETERRSIDTLESELEDLTAELEELPDALETDPDAIEHELETLREQRSNLDSETTQLQSIIQFNEEMLDGTNPEITAALSDDEEGELTDQLLADDGTVVCWTCGTEVDTAQIEATIDRLRSLRQEKVQERNQLRQEIDDRKQTLREARQTKQRRQRVNRQLEETETEIEDRKARIETLTEREDELEETVEELEETVEELEQEDESETLDRQKNVTELEFRLGQLRDDLEDVEAEIEETEDELKRVDDLQAERDAVSERLTDLRTRIDRLERESVDAFNEHMAAVLDVLEYENIERIWIERTEQTVREGRRHVDRPTFELHIVRQAEDGHTYEDTIDHLSESEREVTGLVFALAGYLVHDVYEKVPFMLLDSLEAIDSNRIARLVDYFSEYAETVVTALLPEDAEALDEGYTRITSI